MTPLYLRRPFTLAVHPTARGMGWIVFEGPFAPHDWGHTTARKGDKNAVCLTAVEKLLNRFSPETIVLEAFEKKGSKRADRICRLGRAVVALAQELRIEVAIYTRGDVRACFAGVGASTRQQIAEAVARHFVPLRHRVPKARRPWEADPPRMALFNAAALVLTHYQRGSTLFLESLDYPSRPIGSGSDERRT
jgi:Holliday junction resolvasome RuvABC endonuclease subunit